LIKLASRFIKKGFSLPSGLKKKLQKKHPFTVSRKIPKTKEVTFENDIKSIVFLSVFSVLSYIFENK